MRTPAQLRQEYLQTRQLLDDVKARVQELEHQVGNLTKINEAYQGSFTELMNGLVAVETEISKLIKDKKGKK